MKAALVFLGLIALGFSAPQPRKLFHEHFDDFMEIIVNEAGQQINELQDQYINMEEFQNTIDYITNADFAQLIFEMESLPEFKAVSILFFDLKIMFLNHVCLSVFHSLYYFKYSTCLVRIELTDDTSSYRD